jgi:bifunctional non-homologous end joining protein LigD
MPRKVVPMLATTAPLPSTPRQSAYTFEVKWDGVRGISYIEGGRLHLESRNLRDITPRYPELGGLPAALGARDAVLDGEVVAFNEHGKPSFGLLQHRMHLASEVDVRRRMAEIPIAYMIFDVLWLDGILLVNQPWTERRAVLESLALALDGTERWWQVPSTHPGEGDALVAATKANGLEGVIAKKMDSPYEIGRRSRCWLKVKHFARQEIVIGGWLPGQGNRENRLGALLAGYYDDSAQLRYAGRVGTGFTDQELRRLAGLLAPLARETSPFADPVPAPRGMARWVEPQLVADVDFGEWTTDGTMRHPSYKGLRDDKSASEVRREPIPGRI